MPININSYNQLFIDEETLKAYSLINENVDMKLLTPTIYAVQDLELKKLLGTSLYADLQDKIKADTLNSDELFLMIAYVRNVMVWGIMKKVGYYTTYRYFNAGVQTFNGQNNQPVSKDVLDALSDDANNNFAQYSSDLIRHLRANKDKFPAYNIVGQEDVYPLENPYNNGLSLHAPIQQTPNGNLIRHEWYR